MRQVVVRLSPTVSASAVAEPAAPVAAATARSRAAARSTDCTRVDPAWRSDTGAISVSISSASLTLRIRCLYVAKITSHVRIVPMGVTK